QHLHVKFSIVEQRTRSVGPHDGKASIVRAEIALPEYLAGEVERGEVACAVEDEDALAVGHGRRRGHIAAAFLDVSGRDLLLPANFAVLSIDAEKEQVF